MKTLESTVQILEPGAFLLAYSANWAMGFERNEQLDNFVGEETVDAANFQTGRAIRLTIEQTQLGWSGSATTYTYRLADMQEIDEFAEIRGEDSWAIWSQCRQAMCYRLIQAEAVLSVDFIKDENGQTTNPRSLMDIARHLQDEGYMWSGRMCLSIPGASMFVTFDWDSTWDAIQAAITRVQADPENVQFDQL